MDSIALHCKRMSQLELPPQLSLSITHLSSAQTGVVGSGLVDQLIHHHHQRSKGDSAYSSFSGGSTAPDQPPSSISPVHYAHLQYRKSVCASAHFLESYCSSAHLLHSDPASICTSAQILEPDPTLVCDPTHILEFDHASVCSPAHFQNSEPPSVILQPDQAAVVSLRPHASPGTNNVLKANNRIRSQSPLHPPPIPARLDSFIAIKNLENLRPQQDAEPQQALRPTNRHFFDHTALSQSLSSCSSRQEHRRLSAGWNGSSGGDQHIQKNKRSHSAHNWLSSESGPAPCDPTPTDPLKSDSSVQHKGHFYFVTGVCQPAEGAVRTRLVVTGNSGGDELRERENDLYLPATPHSPDEVFHPLVKDISAKRSHPQPTFDLQGRHTQANPIFYCGPPSDKDGASERISKEATPLLYQLTTSKAVLQQQQWPPREGGCAGGRETGARGEAGASGGAGSSTSSGSVIHPLDDSFHRSYKDKLKVAQSKVLSRTSFQRRDLQLTRPPSLTTSEGAGSDAIVKGIDSEALKFNVAQPRLSQEQHQQQKKKKKKICYSEPEKLHQLGSTPSHAPSHSVSSGSGLVAERRQIFESKGRALSASCATRNHLKHVQHQALLDYMVRKTGQRVEEEPQQHSPPLALALLPTQTKSPSQSRQRHSLGEKPFDWVPNQQEDSSSRKKKQHLQLQRPHSAGRILDASRSSIRYAQFFSTQSSHGRWGQGQGDRASGQVRSVSVESLLEPPELLERQQQRQQAQPFLRTRSTSTPQTLEYLQVCDGDKKLLAEQQGCSNSGSVLKKISSTNSSQPAEGQMPVGWVSQRGQSIEELGGGVQLSSRPPALSRSSEQLEQLRRSHRKSLDTENSKEPLIHSHATKGCSSDQLREPLSSPASSCIGTTTRIWTQPGPPTPATDMPSSNPLSPPAGVEVRSHSSSCTQAMPPRDDTPSSNFAYHLETPQNTALQPGAPQEVSLSCGVTTDPDPSLWLVPPEEEAQERREEVEKKMYKTEVVVPPPTDSLLDQQERESAVSSCNFSTDQYLAEEKKNKVERLEKVKDVNKEMQEEEVIPEEKQEVKKKQTTEERKPSKQGFLWAQLVKAVVSSDQSLARFFYPLANRKTAQMLMEQLLSEDTVLMEEHYRRRKMEQESQEEELGGRAMPSTEDAELAAAPAVAGSNCPDLPGHTHIDQLKRHLVARIKSRLHWLEEKRAPLQVEQEENAARGRSLEAVVRECCPPVELERYLLFVGDLERVVSLLLCLSARLARVENALTTVDQHTDAEEKRCLDSRYWLLCKQQQDATELKENLQRREKMVSTFLQQQLNHQQLLLYYRFLQTTAYLLIRNKELEEEQRLAQEQLEALGAGS